MPLKRIQKNVFCHFFILIIHDGQKKTSYSNTQLAFKSLLAFSFALMLMLYKFNVWNSFVISQCLHFVFYLISFFSSRALCVNNNSIFCAKIFSILSYLWNKLWNIILDGEEKNKLDDRNFSPSYSVCSVVGKTYL